MTRAAVRNNSSIVGALRERMEQRHRADLELLDLMERLANVLSAHHDPVPMVCRPVETQTHFDRVVNALSAVDGWLTVNEIAATTGIDASAVRGVLYSGREHFEKLEESPRRVFWRLIQSGAASRHEPELVHS